MKKNNDINITLNADFGNAEFAWPWIRRRTGVLNILTI